MKTHYENSRPGVALIAIIVLVLIGNLVVAGMVLTVGSSQEVSIRQAESAQALAAAEAGINMALRELAVDTDEDGDGVIGSISNDNNDGNNPRLGQANVKVFKTVLGNTVTLTSYGEAGIANRRIEAQFDMVSQNMSGPGISVSGKIEIDGKNKSSAFIDAYDSSIGPYGLDNSKADVVITTNSTKKDQIKVKSGTIYGDVMVGTDGDTDKVIKVESKGEITGTQGNLDEDIAMIEWDPPFSGSNEGDFKRSGGTYTWTGDHYYKKVEIKDNAIVNVSGHVVIQTKDDFKVKDNARLNILEGSSLTIYCSKQMDFEDDVKVNTDLDDPSKLIIYAAGSGHIDLKDDAEVQAQIYMAGSNHRMEIKDDAQLYGAFNGPELKIKDEARFHIDLASINSNSSVSSGDSSLQLASWQEVSPR